MKLAHFGTFDLENYDDLLFPLLLEHRLGGEAMEFVHVSPTGGAPLLGDCRPVIGYEAALAECESWDGIVVGGGELRRDDSAGEMGNYRDSSIQAIACPGLWFLPALIAQARGIPLVWNAPGVRSDFSDERKRQSMQWACWQANYLAVRDRQSATVLAGSMIEPAVVPDTALEVSRLWPEDALRTEFERLRASAGWPQGRYLAFHLREGYGLSELPELAEAISKICAAHDAAPLLIALNARHGDEAFAQRALAHLAVEKAHLFVPDSLRAVAAAIRFSEGYVGSSLHGAITARSFGRPFLIVAPESRTDVSGLLQQIGAEKLRVNTWAAAARAKWSTTPHEIGEALNRALDQHWAAIASALEASRPVPPHAGPRLVEKITRMPPEWFPFIPLLEQSPVFAPIFEKYKRRWTLARRQLQNPELTHRSSEEKVAALLTRIRKRDERIKVLQEQKKTLEESLRAHAKTIYKRSRQVDDLQQNDIQKRDAQLEEMQQTLSRLEGELQRASSDTANLETWSDQLLNDFQKILRSSRWHLGCWLSLKRGGAQSNEARRLAQLIAHRPHASPAEQEFGAGIGPTNGAGNGRDVAPPPGPASQTVPAPAFPLDAPRPNQGQFVAIIIPVFNAFEDLVRCLESVQRHSRPEHPVIVLDDASTDERIWLLLEEWAAQHPSFQIVRHETNLGYTATVNRGCELAGPVDVILLNSDTIVPPRWIEQMAACAYSQPGVATVTAISNAAGAFSFPQNNTVNPLPNGWSADEMAAFVEKTSRRIRPAVPTGNGFCLYLTSAALASIGPFDEENFPRGYGEENDFCLRASAAGFVNLIDDATYVFHQRSASFGVSKAEVLEASRAVLDRLHPDYTERIEEWSRADPLDPARLEMQRQLEVVVAEGMQSLPSARSRPCLLFVLQGSMGGTRFTTEDLSQEMASYYRTVVLHTALDSWTLYEDFGAGLIPVRRYVFSDVWRIDQPLTPDRAAAFREICSDYGVTLAHVRHLLGSGPEVLGILRERKIPIVFSFHDFYTVCPTIQLLDEKQNFCAGRCTTGAGDCSLAGEWFPAPHPWLKHRYVHEHQGRMSAALKQCDAWITTSETSRALIKERFPGLDDARFTVIEHGWNLPRLELAKAPEKGQPLRAVLFGFLTPAKGLDLVSRLLERNREAGNPIELHILGPKSPAFDPESLGAIFHGRYQRDELADRIRSIKPAVSLIPSLWPETYCHVLTESWAMGLPVLASDIGTLRERLLKHRGGWLLPVGDAGAWLAKMRQLVDDPREYGLALEEIRKLVFPDVPWMARQYQAVYERVLERARPTSSSNGHRNHPEIDFSPVPGTLAARWELRGPAFAPPDPGLRQGSRKPRVLVVGHWLGSMLFGSENSLLDTIFAIDPERFDVFAIFPTKNERVFRKIQPHVQGVAVLDYEWWRLGRPASAETVDAFAEIYRSQAIDLVHVNTIVLRDPLIAARRAGLPSISNARELISLDDQLAAQLGGTAKEIAKAVCENATYVLANSAATLADYPCAGKGTYAYNCVDAAAFDFPHVVNPAKIHVGLISSNVEKKGVADFLEIARRAENTLPTLEFHLIGPENDLIREWQAKEEFLPRNFHMLGYIPQPSDAYRNLNIVLNLSRFAESFGRTVAEAMAARRAVIAYRFGALPELIDHGDTGFLTPYRDLNAVLDRLAFFAAHPAEISEFGERARAQAIERFSPAVLRSAITKIYDHLLSESQASIVSV